MSQKRIGTKNYYNFLRFFFNNLNDNELPPTDSQLNVPGTDSSENSINLKQLNYSLSHPALKYSTYKQLYSNNANPNILLRFHEHLYNKVEYSEPKGIKRRYRQKALLSDLFTIATSEEAKLQRVVEKIKKEPNLGLITHRKLPLFEVLPELDEDETKNCEYSNPYLIEGINWMCLDGDSKNRCRSGKLFFNYETFLKSLKEKKIKPNDQDVVFGSAKYKIKKSNKCVGWEKPRLQWLIDLERRQKKEERRRKKKKKCEKEEYPVTIFCLPFPKILLK